MTFTAHGIDGVLLVLAALLFLIAAILAWTGHRATMTLVAAGLFLWVLTALVR